MGNKYISHKGSVTSISDERIYITIKSESACGSCHAKGACAMSEEVEKIVDVCIKTYPSTKIGDDVDVIISKKTGIISVVIAYIIPIFIILLSLYIFSSIELSEPLSLVFMLLLLLFYFTILYFFRTKLASKINIQIRI